MSVAFSGADNAVTAKVDDFYGSISGTFKFSWLFIWTSGKFKVRLDKDGSITMATKIPLIS